MKRIPIGEFATLGNTTVETLRHYDKLGLLKPAFVDEQTNYRYYTMTQYERLSIILAFRHMDVSLDDIQEYFEYRTLANSLSLLKKYSLQMDDKIARYQVISENIKKKIAHLEQFSQIDKNGEIQYKKIATRTIQKRTTCIPQRNDAFWHIIRPKSSLDMDRLPNAFASDNYGIMFLEDGQVTVFGIVATNSQTKSLDVLPESLFICTYFYGDDVTKIQRVAEELSKYAQKDGYEVLGCPIAICQVDMLVTGVEHELLYEVQIPIKNA